MSKEPRDVVERWFKSLSTRDFEAYSATMHEDLILNVAGRTAVSGRWFGKKMLFEKLLPLVMGNLVEETVNLSRRYRIMAVDGPIVASIMEGIAMNKSGEPYEQTYCQFFRVEDGLIVEMWEFFDTVQAEARLFHKDIACGEKPSPALEF